MWQINTANFFLFLCFLSILCFAGCASYPNVTKIIADTPADSSDILTRHNSLMNSLNEDPLTTGNKVTLLADISIAYDAMFEAINRAENHINIETFSLEDNDHGGKIADILLRKKSQGVQVNILYDCSGSSKTPTSYFKRLIEGGICLVPFSPPFSQKGLRFRIDHRKILIVDGKTAFTGGVNLTQGYDFKPQQFLLPKAKSLPWQDTIVKIQGPAVAQFQKLFFKSWLLHKSAKAQPDYNYYPPLMQEGNSLVRVVASTPGKSKRLTYIMYISAISSAKRSIYLTTPYFVPDRQLLKALTDAAKRDVDVKLLLPEKTDCPMCSSAAKVTYSRLLKSGVKIYHRQNVFLHAKTAVIDGVWSTVGSTNLDTWSLLSNDEANSCIYDPDFAAQMENLFNDDIANSQQIQLDQWQKRSLVSKLDQWFASLFAYWL